MEHVNNNLSLCLAAIAGKVDPNTVKYHNGLEYQLLKIAGMTEEDGGGGDDTPSENKYIAKRVTTRTPNAGSGQTDSYVTKNAWMVEVDLGIDDTPYATFIAIVNIVDGKTYKSGKNVGKVIRSSPFHDDGSGNITFGNNDIANSIQMTATGLYQTDYIRAFFIQNDEIVAGHPNPLRLQMFIYPAEDSEDEKEMTINVTFEEYIDSGDGGGTK